MNLNAIDTDELKIIATILQDGLVEVSEVKYLPSIRSFIIMITRFMWEEKIINKENKRVKAVLVYEDVLSVFSKNIDQMNKSNTLELMTFNYFPTKSKNIEISPIFLGGPMGPIHPVWGHLVIFGRAGTAVPWTAYH